MGMVMELIKANYSALLIFLNVWEV
jgi:hypothetical protein